MGKEKASGRIENRLLSVKRRECVSFSRGTTEACMGENRERMFIRPQRGTVIELLATANHILT